MSSVVNIFVVAFFLTGFRYCCAENEKFTDETRPYEFSFNIEDFQHRLEKKGDDGIITGEFGWISADGVYRETSYATDKNGDFKITGMNYRKIKSVKDAKILFEKKPEAAKMLAEALTRACSGCELPAEEDAISGSKGSTNEKLDESDENEFGTFLEKMKNDFARNGKIVLGPSVPNYTKGPKLTAQGLTLREKIPSRTTTKMERGRTSGAPGDAGTMEKGPGDLSYFFNYTTTSHGHQEQGFRGGEKKGGYRAENGNGIETRVAYVSNGNGHQPIVTFSLVPASGRSAEATPKGNSLVSHWN